MHKRIYIFLLILMGTVSLQAQDIVQKALVHLQNNELESAKETIDKAVQLELHNQKAITWFYYGYIYKELYKAHDIGNLNSVNLNLAADAYLKALEMDNNHAERNNNILGMKYLAAQYFNIAGTILNQASININIDTVIINKAENLYAKYKQLMKAADPSFSATESDISYYTQLGVAYQLKYDTLKHQRHIYQPRVEHYYKKVLELDKDNVSTLYNLGSIYYNHGADIINNTDYDEDLIVLNEKMDLSLEYFLKALPYLKRAYELDPKRKNTLIGLSNIFYSLNDLEKSDHYKHELKMLNVED